MYIFCYNFKNAKEEDEKIFNFIFIRHYTIQKKETLHFINCFILNISRYKVESLPGIYFEIKYVLGMKVEGDR